MSPRFPWNDAEQFVGFLHAFDANICASQWGSFSTPELGWGKLKIQKKLLKFPTTTYSFYLFWAPNKRNHQKNHPATKLFKFCTKSTRKKRFPTSTTWPNHQPLGGSGCFLTPFKWPFMAYKWGWSYLHQTFQVPKMEVLTYVSCM